MDEELLRNAIHDLVGNFLYYDRKEDEELPVDAIQDAISADPALKLRIVIMFTDELSRQLRGGE